MPNLPSDLPPVVIAGTYPQFLTWCKEQHISPINGAIFTQEPDRLRGLQGNPIVRIGTWRENPCAHIDIVAERETIGHD